MMGQADRWPLPGNWAWARFEDVAEIAQDLVAPSKVLDLPHIAPNHIGSGDRRLLPFSTVRADGVISAKQRFYPGQILFTKIRPYLLKSVLVEFEGVCSADMYPLWIRKSADPNYVLYWLTSPDFRDEIAMQQGRTVLPKINQPGLNASQIAVPPLPEQRRIVAKIDSLTGKSRRARDHLDHIPRLVEKYKQAVLAAAFRGELTQEWRKAKDLPDLRSVRLGDVTEGFNYGSAAKSAKEGAVPVLRMGNIQDGKLDWADLVFTNDAAEIVKYRLVPGDVLFNRTNSPALVGKTALYDGDREAIYAGYLIKVRCKPELLPAFLTYCLNSPMGRAYSWAVKSDGVSQSNINAKKLAAFRFDLPSQKEQAEILRRIGTAFAWIDRLASEATSARRLIDRLDQAVLAKAFRGELVPQDRADEPASVLLERIKAERGAAPKVKRGRKVRAA